MEIYLHFLGGDRPENSIFAPLRNESQSQFRAELFISIICPNFYVVNVEMCADFCSVESNLRY